jgi:hypothetical protein
VRSPESLLGAFVTFPTSTLRARRTLNRRLQLCLRIFGEVFASLLVVQVALRGYRSHARGQSDRDWVTRGWQYRRDAGPAGPVRASVARSGGEANTYLKWLVLKYSSYIRRICSSGPPILPETDTREASASSC